MPGRIRPQPLIAVRDVRASTRWYEQLLQLKRLRDSEHDHIWQQLLDGNEPVLQLHSWDDDDHPNLTDPGKAPTGHGVLIWFEVEDFEGVVRRAEEMSAQIVTEPVTNENSGHREIWIQDPDGYVVVAA